MTEVQRIADLRDEVDAAREDGDLATVGTLLLVESERQLRFLRADLERERGLPKERQSPERLRAAEDALRRENERWTQIHGRYRGAITGAVLEEDRQQRAERAALCPPPPKPERTIAVDKDQLPLFPMLDSPAPTP